MEKTNLFNQLTDDEKATLRDYLIGKKHVALKSSLRTSTTEYKHYCQTLVTGLQIVINELSA